MPLERMLRMILCGTGPAVGVPGSEEALHDIESVRRFAGIELGEEEIPDETTILNFRHLLEKHQLTEKLLEEVNGYLSEKRLLLRQGTISRRHADRMRRPRPRTRTRNATGR